MQEGFIPDYINNFTANPRVWVEGAREKTWSGGVKTSDRLVLFITTYRCSKCGYLESYTRRG